MGVCVWGYVCVDGGEGRAAWQALHLPTAPWLPAAKCRLPCCRPALQVSPRDCTGCDLCTHACPDNALVATPLEQVRAPAAGLLPGPSPPPFTQNNSRWFQPRIWFMQLLPGHP